MTSKDGMHHISIDHNAYVLLDEVKGYVRSKGINKPSYSDSIRHMYSNYRSTQL